MNLLRFLPLFLVFIFYSETSLAYYNYGYAAYPPQYHASSHPCYSPIEAALLFSKPKSSQKKKSYSAKIKRWEKSKKKFESFLDKSVEELGDSLNEKNLGANQDPHDVADQIREYIDFESDEWECESGSSGSASLFSPFPVFFEILQQALLPQAHADGGQGLAGAVQLSEGNVAEILDGEDDNVAPKSVKKDCNLYTVGTDDYKNCCDKLSPGHPYHRTCKENLRKQTIKDCDTYTKPNEYEVCVKNFCSKRENTEHEKCKKSAAPTESVAVDHGKCCLDFARISDADQAINKVTEKGGKENCFPYYTHPKENINEKERKKAEEIRAVEKKLCESLHDKNPVTPASAQTNCPNNPKWKKDPAFKKSGKVEDKFCKNFAKNKSDCKTALSDIKDILKNIDELKDRIREARLAEARSNLKDEDETKTEAGALCIECLREYRELSKPTGWQKFGNMASIALGAGLGYYAIKEGRKVQKDVNELRAWQGYEAQNNSWNYTMAGLGIAYPFISKGIYGLANPNPSYCSPTVNPYRGW